MTIMTSCLVEFFLSVAILVHFICLPSQNCCATTSLSVIRSLKRSILYNINIHCIYNSISYK